MVEAQLSGLAGLFVDNLLVQGLGGVQAKHGHIGAVLIDELTALIATVNAGYTVSTGIGGILFDEVDAVIYDARGRKVKNITSPGIYIVNGKKVYVK